MSKESLTDLRSSVKTTSQTIKDCLQRIDDACAREAPFDKELHYVLRQLLVAGETISRARQMCECAVAVLVAGDDHGKIVAHFTDKAYTPIVGEVLDEHKKPRTASPKA